ncbi:MAG: hypothetical protein WKG32_18705 [Gemmatimonadaceae bacterium]
MSWPRPGRAVAAAIVTTAAIGVALTYPSGGMWREPPLPAYGGMTRLVAHFRHANEDGPPPPRQVLVLGSSLTRYGIVQEQLQHELGTGTRVVVLPLDGASIWEVLRLARRFDRPRAPGPNVAIVEVRRAEFRAVDLYRYERFVLRDKPEFVSAPGRLGALRQRVSDLTPPRQQITAWWEEVRYGWLPRLGVRPSVPEAEPHRLWAMSPARRQETLRDFMPERAARMLRNRKFSRPALATLRLLVAELQGRGYRVLLFSPPVSSRYLATLDTLPAGAVAEAAYRATILSADSTGADAVIAFGTERSLGVGSSIFYDYGHLRPEGAARETRRIAEALDALGWLRR